MGWDSANNWQKKADAVADTTNGLLRNGHQIIDQAGTAQGAYWVIQPKDSENRIIYSAIFRHTKDRGFKRIWIKTMSECMGPYIDDCPIRLLDQCTPTEILYANEFRNRCREFHRTKRRANGR